MGKKEKRVINLRLSYHVERKLLKKKKFSKRKEHDKRVINLRLPYHVKRKLYGVNSIKEGKNTIREQTLRLRYNIYEKSFVEKKKLRKKKKKTR